MIGRCLSLQQLINHTKLKYIMTATAFNTKFKVITPQKFQDRIVNIEGYAGNIHADFFFVHPTEGRIEVASFNAETGELKEKISGIVSIIQ